ncbi:MAG: RDD family protein [Cyclobacteriaceae bacterium]|nr:RDD family protein [Cyclobacteriaceae bacterium]
MLTHYFTFDTSKTLFWKRLIAQFIDFILISLIVTTYSIWYGNHGMGNWMLIWGYLFYSILMDAYASGTIGKWIMGLRVIMIAPSNSKLLTAFYRNYMKILLSIIGFDILLVPFIRGFSGIHNRVAQTRVIKK